MNRPRMVYFARCLGPWGTPMGAIKVGCSYGHELRVKAISSNQPYSLELITAVPGEMLLETLVHLYLQKHRIAGEFFHENAYVTEYLEGVIERGTAFVQMDAPPQGDYLPDGSLDAFLKYHGLTLNRVFEFLGREPKVIADIGRMKNRKLIAAAMLIARWEGDGRYVHWPADCVRGLLGEVHPHVRPLIEDQDLQVAA